MKFKNSDKYIVLASSCQLVIGANRSVIIDHRTGNLFFVSSEYAWILNQIDRKLLRLSYNLFEDETSVAFFEQFVDYLLINNLAFFTEHIDCFPQRSLNDFEEDAQTKVYNSILEIDAKYFNMDRMFLISKNLDNLRCKDVQIRFLSMYNSELMKSIITSFEGTTVNYIEVHCQSVREDQLNDIEALVLSERLISHFFIYDWSFFGKKELILNYENEKFLPIEAGTIYFLKYPFNDGGCCGQIFFETLEFSNLDLHHKLKKTNGCLDRKVTIDRFGYIKNCPSRPEKYGNIENASFSEVLENPDFKMWWYIHKDQIEVCRDCEFRYNCTDCRAFLKHDNDIYSKPLKCGYNPYNNVWEEWSKNDLKYKEIVNLTANV